MARRLSCADPGTDSIQLTGGSFVQQAFALYYFLSMTKQKVLTALTLTLFVFSFVGWIYIVINSEVHPWTLGKQLTHFWKYPHEDTFGEICFAVSFVSFFAYNLIKPDKGSSAE